MRANSGIETSGANNQPRWIEIADLTELVGSTTQDLIGIGF